MKDEDIDPGFLESRAMDLLAKYLESGRRFERLSIDQLRNKWIATFQKMIENPLDQKTCELHDALDSEFAARRTDAPYELIDVEAYTAAADQALDEIRTRDPDHMDQIDAELVSDLMTFRRPKHRKN